MISKPSKFEMDGVTFEANWCKSVTPCRSIRIKVKGKSAEINPNDLYALLMLYADEQQMSDCLGVKDEEVVMVKKLMAVRTKNDIKAGEQVTFTIEYPVTVSAHKKYEEMNQKFYTEEEAKLKITKS